MDRQEYTQKTDMFYAEMLEFIISRKELFSKMAMYEKLFDYPGIDPAQRKSQCLDWFIFDYREQESARSVLDLFLEQAELAPEKRQLYEGFKNNVFSVFEVKAIKTGKQARLVDFFRNVEHQVTDTTFTKSAQRGDLCVIRILPFEDIKIIAGDGYLFPRDTATHIKINREKFSALKGGLTPLDVVKMFYGSDKSSKMTPKEKLLYLAGRAGISDEKIEALIDKMEKQAAGTGDPVQIIRDFVSSTGKPDSDDMVKTGKAAIDYWNFLIGKSGDAADRGPVEKALLELAFSRFNAIVNDEKEKDPEKAQAKMDEWFKSPLAVINGKTPEQAIIEERKKLGNPELRVGFSFNASAIRNPEAKKIEKETEKLFYQGIDYMRENKHKKALASFEEYNKLWDGNHVVYFNMGSCHFFMENYAAAKACLKKALKIDPDYKKARDAMFDLNLRELEGKIPGKKRQRKSCKVLQFYITLKGAEPKIWRRIEVKEDIGLRTFAVAILLAMGWKNSHLHEFIIDGKHYGIMSDEAMDMLDDMPMEDELNYRLKDFKRKQLNEFKFLYDFGDGWEHDVSPEHAHEPEEGVFYPRCIAGGRNCPPEDCGGIGGYEDLVEKIRNPGHEEYEELIEWLGGKYDPDFFDAELVSHEMTKTEAYERYGFEDDESAADIVEDNEYKNCGIGTIEDLKALQAAKNSRKSGNKKRK